MFETSWLALDTKIVLKGPQYFEHSSKELLSFLWLNVILSLSQFTMMANDIAYFIQMQKKYMIWG